ncbi:MAG TPA: CpsD/CapB family tyrosine-protein kinase [Vicinamibacterales bacterium]
MSRIDSAFGRTIRERSTPDDKVVDVTTGMVLDPNFRTDTPAMRPVEKEPGPLFVPEQADHRRSGVPVNTTVPSAVANHLANLAQVLYLHPTRPRTIALVASGRREGTTTFLANLGNYLAHQRSRVLMVDANLSSPTLHTLVGANASPGLIEVLTGEADAPKAIQSTAVPNLSVLTCGDRPLDGTTHLVLPDVLRDRLFNTTLDYDFILVDCPALNASEGTAVTAATCDATLLIVEGGRTMREQAQAAKTLLMRADCTILGVVMNKRKFYIPKFLYDRL